MQRSSSTIQGQKSSTNVPKSSTTSVQKFTDIKKSSSNIPVPKSPSTLPVPTTSKQIIPRGLGPAPAISEPDIIQPWYFCCYNKEKKTVCGRSCSSWLKIITYAIFYIIFLTTYTLAFLIGSLAIIRYYEEYLHISDKTGLATYIDNGIGITAVPSSGDSSPLIWYRVGELDQYDKYVKALDNLLNKMDEDKKGRNKRDTGDLGPCGISPYGYGTSPCIVVKINKLKGWVEKPLKTESSHASTAPKEVLQWLKLKQEKLWLRCDGYYPWDREHLGQIKYHPYPPGFDPAMFPLNMSSPSPLLGVQFTNFTLGLSISIQCKLWYATGTSSLEFLLYVAQPRKF